MTPLPRVRWGWYECSTYWRFNFARTSSNIWLKWDAEEVLQQRDNKHSKRNQMSIETVSVEQTMGNTTKLKWKGEMGWGNGFEVRCGLEGLPPVVVTLFGRVGVGSNHQVEAASLAGSSGLGVGRHDIGWLNTLNRRAGREYPPGNFTLSSFEVTWWILSSISSADCI